MGKCLVCGGSIPQGSNNCPGCGVVVGAGASNAETVASTRPSLDDAVGTGRPSRDEIQAGFQQSQSNYQNPNSGFQQPMQHSAIPTHLVKAILTTLFCCLPFGIASIVFASQVNTKELQGDIGGAHESSNKADSFANWGIGLGVIGTIINIVLQVAAVGVSGY